MEVLTKHDQDQYSQRSLVIPETLDSWLFLYFGVGFTKLLVKKKMKDLLMEQVINLITGM